MRLEGRSGILRAQLRKAVESERITFVAGNPENVL